MADQLFIKNGIVRTATTGKRASKLKVQGYEPFVPGKPSKPAPTAKQETE